MLARSGAQGEQPLLRLFQQPWIDIGIGDQAREQGFGLCQRLLRPLQRRHGGFRGIGAGHLRLSRWRQTLQRSRSGAQRGSGARVAAIAWCQFRQGCSDRLRSALILLQPLPLSGQRFFLVDPRRQGRQLIDGMAEPFLIAFSRGDCRAGVIQPGQRVPPDAPRRGHGRSDGRRNPERIQQTGMAGRVGQAHLFVLALHFHQQHADPPQQADAHRMVVDEGARPPVLGDDPAQHDLVLTRQAVLVQHVRHPMIVRR